MTKENIHNDFMIFMPYSDDVEEIIFQFKVIFDEKDNAKYFPSTKY